MGDRIRRAGARRGTAARAQTDSASPAAPPTPARHGTPPAQLSGDITTTGQLYGAAGVPDRWPGQSWSIEMNPEATLFGTFHLGFGLVLSSQGDQYRQNIDQYGLNPPFGWVTLHLGDFSKDYAPYTVQGTRVRGGGFDLEARHLPLLAPGRAHAACRLRRRRGRHLLALPVRRTRRNRQGNVVVCGPHVRQGEGRSVVGAAGPDRHAAAGYHPRRPAPAATEPARRNFVVGLSGQGMLFDSRLVVAGDAAGALITRDLTSPSANPGSVTFGRVLNALIPFRLSTGGDYAYHLHGTLDLGTASLKAGWQYVGPGYTSLGLSYLINDREGYDFGGSVRLLKNSLSLQGELQHQNDNLLGQKVAATNNDSRRRLDGILAHRAHADHHALRAEQRGGEQLAGGHVRGEHPLDRPDGHDGVAGVAVPPDLGPGGGLHPAAHHGPRSVHPLATHDGAQRLAVGRGLADVRDQPGALAFQFAATQTTGAATQENVYAGFRGQGRFRQAARVRGDVAGVQRGPPGVRADLGRQLPAPVAEPALAAAALHELHRLRHHARVRRVVRHPDGLAELLTSRARPDVLVGTAAAALWACQEFVGPGTVEGRLVRRIVINVGQFSVNQGDTLRLTAALFDQTNTAYTTVPPGITLVWSSSAPATMTVNQTGLVTGVTPGQATVTVSTTVDAGTLTISATGTVVYTGPQVATLLIVAGDSQTVAAGLRYRSHPASKRSMGRATVSRASRSPSPSRRAAAASPGRSS